MAVQQVIIPKGLVDPNQTTIVEIPDKLKNATTIIATSKTPTAQDVTLVRPEQKVIQKTSYTRRTIPKKNLDSEQNDSCQKPSNQTQQFRTPNRYYRDVDQSVGQDFDYSASEPGYSKRSFTPDPQEMSYFEESYMETTPEQIAQSREEYYATKDSSRSTSASSKKENTPANELEAMAKKILASAKYYAPRVPGKSQQCPSDILDALSKLESSECSKVLKDLNKFQSARRKLVLDVSNLANSTDFACDILNCKQA